MDRNEATQLYAATLLAAGYTRYRPHVVTTSTRYIWNRPDGTRATTGDLNSLLATTLPPETLGHLLKSYTWRLVALAADA